MLRANLKSYVNCEKILIFCDTLLTDRNYNPLCFLNIADFKQALRVFILLLLVFLQVSCGFEWRQANNLPPEWQSISLTCQDEKAPTCEMLKQMLPLQYSSVADAVITIKKETFQKTFSEQESTTLAAANTSYTTLSLVYEVTYRTKTAGEKSFQEQTVSEQQQLFIDGNNLLSTDNQIAQIELELANGCANQLIDRLYLKSKTR